MRIKKMQLKHFKRFSDLTINLGDNPKKIIALVGPNGCGKSSIFDAFEEEQKKYKGANSTRANDFFDKSLYTANSENKSTGYQRNEAIKITETEGKVFERNSFYIRSSYRFSPQIQVSQIKALPDSLDDINRPTSSIDLDTRLPENYERLLGKTLSEWDKGTKSGPEMRKELLGKINKILDNVIDIKISSLGSVISGKGKLYFEKGISKNFPYENLSSGEKEVVDIIIDLVVKVEDFNNTIYCIDEPELHLNTAIQRKLLNEIERLIPDNCQLWIATHSIGFLRALQQDLKEKCSILDFSNEEHFDSTYQIEPMSTTRKNWQRIFQTALEDLTGLIAPQEIIYCEGAPNPGIQKNEQGLDADIYNEIFSEIYHDTLFVSGGGTDVTKNASLALKILNKAFVDVKILVLKDRDKLTDEGRNDFLKRSKDNRMLERREIENYLFDKEVLKFFCSQKNITFNEAEYDTLVTNIINQDLKPIQQKFQNFCKFSGEISSFEYELAKILSKVKSTYSALEEVIFASEE